MSFASDYIWDVWSETSERFWDCQNYLFSEGMNWQFRDYLSTLKGCGKESSDELIIAGSVAGGKAPFFKFETEKSGVPSKTGDRRPEKGKSAGETDPLTGMAVAASPDLTGRGRPERQTDAASQLVSPDTPPSILL